MNHSLDLLELENTADIDTEDGRALALESYKFRWINLPGISYDPNDSMTIFAEQLNNILDRLDAGAL
jgi:hypothetical protein